MQFTYLSPLQMRKFSLTNLPSRICTLIKFSLTCFVARAHGMLLNIYITSRLPLFARTIEMFLLHLSRFPRRPYTRTRLAWLWLEQGWHDYDWNKAPWQGKMSIFCRAHEQVKLVKVFRTVNLTSRHVLVWDMIELMNWSQLQCLCICRWAPFFLTCSFRLLNEYVL
jgi:hypothetical protein